MPDFNFVVTQSNANPQGIQSLNSITSPAPFFTSSGTINMNGQPLIGTTEIKISNSSSSQQDCLISNVNLTFQDVTTTETMNVDRQKIQFSIAGETSATTSMQHDKFEVVDENLKTASLLGATLSFSDTNSTAYNSLDKDVLTFTNTGFNNNQTCVIGTNGGTECGLTIKSNIFSGSESAASLTFSSADEPKLRLFNGLNSMDLRISSGEFNHKKGDIPFKFTGNQTFFKWNNGTSFKIDLNQSLVNITDSFKVSDGFYFEFSSYPNYLDADGNGGWSVVLCNTTDSSLNVISPDLWFFSSGSGQSFGTFDLTKWATARVTLVPTNNRIYGENGFAWAVSMY